MYINFSSKFYGFYGFYFDSQQFLGRFVEFVEQLVFLTASSTTQPPPLKKSIDLGCLLEVSPAHP